MTIRDRDPEIVRLFDVAKMPIRTIARLVEVHHSVVERVLRQHGLLPKGEAAEPAASTMIAKRRPRMIDSFWR